MRSNVANLLVCLCICASPVAAQTGAPRGGVSLQVGASWSGLVDRNASPLVYRGPGAGVAVGWRGIYESRRVETDVSGSVSRLRSRISNAAMNRESALNAAVRLALLARVGSLAGGDISLFAGAQLLLSGLGRQHSFPFGATETFADAFGTLGAAGAWEYRRAGGTVLAGTAALPIASVVARTPWHGLKTTPQFTLRGPLSFTTVTHALRLERPVGPRVAWLVDYRTTLQRDDVPRELRRIDHWLGIGLEVRRSPR